jgi:hypothetical protein
MLDLRSPIWSRLKDAYGSAAGVPALITRLSKGGREVLGDLYGAICHQGTVYDASFAAVPHLVDIALSAQDPNFRAEVLVLVGSIAKSTDDARRGPSPADIHFAYAGALDRARPLIASTLKESLKPPGAIYLLEAAAALAGFTTLGRVLTGFVDKEFHIACPACARELYIWPSETGLETAAEDPVRDPHCRRTPVSSGPTPDSPLQSSYDWLLREGGVALQEIRPRLPYLFGSGTCPSCGAPFCLLDELALSSS